MAERRRRPIPREFHKAFALELAVFDRRLGDWLKKMSDAGMVLKNQDKIVRAANSLQLLKNAFALRMMADNPEINDTPYDEPATRDLAKQLAAEFGDKIATAAEALQ